MPPATIPLRMIAELLRAKLSEQIDCTRHLVRLVPSEALDRSPNTLAGRSVGELLGHLLDCLAGFCATLYAVHPAELADFNALRALPVNHRCEPEEAGRRIRQYEDAIERGFALLADSDLERSIPTVFVPRGEALATLLLGNLEHLINHKHELFTYLKWLGVPVGSPDLYRHRS